MSSLKELFEEKWSAAVKAKVEPPEDLFAKGSSQRIVAWLMDTHKTKGKAMSALNFYINRAGKNLPAKRKEALEIAKGLLQGKK